VSDTPRTDAEAFLPHDSKYRVCDADFARSLERELNAANAIIRQQQLLDEENLRLQDRIKRLEAVTNDPHALWINWLRGSVTLPVGIGDVSEYQDRIKRLEEAGDAMERLLPDGSICDKVANLWLKAKEAKP
jgi:hypothetical protein